MHQFQVRTRVVSGNNILGRLGSEVRGLGVGRLFLVTDKFLKTVGIVDRVSGELQGAGLELVIFDGVETEPTHQNISEAIEIFRHSGCEAVLGLGGGSSIDTAKAVGILATNPGPLTNYQGEDRFAFPPLPVIAVPTTAGTGSEVTGYCVFIDEDRGCKTLVSSPLIQPVLAVLDPCLLNTVPPRVAAATGVDTLSRAVEAYLSTGSAPITDALALDAIRLVAGNLPVFVANNKIAECAGNMQMACVMAALAMHWAGGGAVRAMAHALSGCYRIPHGVASAVLLPHVMNFNLISSLEKFKRIAAALGSAAEGLSPLDAARQSVSMVKDLNRALGIPSGLRELGVTEDSIEPMSRETVRSELLSSNPRETSLEDVAGIFRDAMD